MTTPSIRPVFILSLPRSGSTLLQRLLARHPAIATTPEPWLLLPVLDALDREGSLSRYSHKTAWDGLQDFLSSIDEGQTAYLTEVRRFALNLYARACSGPEAYFLDKTPRYHFIIDSLIKTFPDAHFIFLWRNPLAVTASIIRTWGGGRWIVNRFKRDLFGGFENLVSAWRQGGVDATALRYEDLIADPNLETQRIFDDLRLEPRLEDLTEVQMDPLIGRTGDPTGQYSLTRVQRSTSHPWPVTFNNPLRRRWADRYLEWIGRHRLAAIGYDIDQLGAELHSTALRNSDIAEDVLWATFGIIWDLSEPHAVMRKVKAFPDWTRIYSFD